MYNIFDHPVHQQYLETIENQQTVTRD